MKGSKGFTNKAKSGAKATTARRRQAAAKAKLEVHRDRTQEPKKSRRPRKRGKK